MFNVYSDITCSLQIENLDSDNKTNSAQDNEQNHLKWTARALEPIQFRQIWRDICIYTQKNCLPKWILNRMDSEEICVLKTSEFWEHNYRFRQRKRKHKRFGFEQVKKVNKLPKSDREKLELAEYIGNLDRSSEICVGPKKQRSEICVCAKYKMIDISYGAQLCLI